MAWFKWRERFSSGPSKTWDYVEIDTVQNKNENAEFIEEVLDMRGLLNNSLDHYRGIEIVPIEFPPISYCRERIKSLRSIIDRAQKEIDRLSICIDN